MRNSNPLRSIDDRYTIWCDLHEPRCSTYEQHWLKVGDSGIPVFNENGDRVFKVVVAVAVLYFAVRLAVSVIFGA